MTDDDPGLLAAGVGTFVGQQVILLGLLMLSLGILVGINIVARPAAIEHYTPLLGYSDLPAYLERAALVSKVAAATALASALGLVYLDYTHD